jgi:hypothetical protein
MGNFLMIQFPENLVKELFEIFPLTLNVTRIFLKHELKDC